MKIVAIVGATRNLGKSLLQHYSSEPDTVVYATTRYGKPFHHGPNVHWISGIDITDENAGHRLALHYYHEFKIDIVYVVATASNSLFAAESLNDIKVEKELRMYKTSAIGPLCLVQHLQKAHKLAKNAKVILIGNAAGSISLRARGGNYGFHGSQAALNMTAKLLAFDLRPENVAIGVVYPGEIILEDEAKHKDSEHKIKPEVAVQALTSFVEKEFGMEKSGEVWASLGFDSVPELANTSFDTSRENEPAIQLPW